jgi:hypothetical protein
MISTFILLNTKESLETYPFTMSTRKWEEYGGVRFAVDDNGCSISPRNTTAVPAGTSAAAHQREKSNRERVRERSARQAVIDAEYCRRRREVAARTKARQDFTKVMAQLTIRAGRAAEDPKRN